MNRFSLASAAPRSRLWRALTVVLVVWVGLALALHHGVPSALGASHKHGGELPTVVECPAVLADSVDAPAPAPSVPNVVGQVAPPPEPARAVKSAGIAPVAEIVSRGGPPRFRRLCVDRR